MSAMIQETTFRWMRDLKLNLTLNAQRLRIPKETSYQTKYENDFDLMNHYLYERLRSNFNSE